MLYYLFTYLDKVYDFPGAGLFNYISFRAAMSALFSLLIILIFGKPFINYLKKKQIGEEIRHLGLQAEDSKKGTPTMGGVLIFLAIVIPVLLFSKLENIYVILMLVTTFMMAALGFVDDYIKVFKKNKKGLSEAAKIIVQLILGLIVALVMYNNQNLAVREQIFQTNIVEDVQETPVMRSASDYFGPEQVGSLKTTIPFVKNNQFDYANLVKWIGEDYQKWAWLVFVPIILIIVLLVTNGANLADGLDGLCAGTSAVVGAGLAIFAWVSGNFVFASYLNILYLPNSGELTVFIASFVGSLIGFMWFNSYPAKIFMGDTGSLMIGGIIAVFAILVRKELLLPLLCLVFLIEICSSAIQRYVFKYRKWRFGLEYAQNHRVFLMAPLHHHFQKKGWHEVTIVNRFIIINIIAVILAVITLKIR
ncbi:MAG: phospho-N-acetylmuramoyl-pentapeptide-transferase [Bacteroidales bacterium]|nr:phospho-N-acetylmuramoyl-pentapeptide-transferase [Bacteroidales bacterium]